MRRFAGLLLVTKCLPPDDIDVRREVFDAVGSSFLLRLLLPLRQGRIYPKALTDDGEIEKQIQLAGLGLSVIVNLSVCKEVASSEEMGKVCMIALEALKHGPSRLIARYLQLEDSQVSIPSSVEMTMLANCCDCIALIGSEHGDGMDAVLNAGCFQVFAQQLELLYAKVSDSEHGDVERAYYESLCRCITVCVFEGGKRGVTADVLIPVLSTWFAIMSRKGDDAILHRDGHLQYHFEALQCLTHIFEMKGHCSEPGWIQKVIYGLESLFASRVPDVERYHALQLTLHLITMEGISWLYSNTIFELLVQTLRVEIGVLMLDAIAPDAVIEESLIPSGAQPDEAHASEETSADIADRLGDMHVRENGRSTLAGTRAIKNLPMCLILFEYMVEALSSAVSNDSASISDEVIQRIFEALTEIAELELQFLEQTAGDEESRDDDMNQLFSIIWGTFCTFAAQNPHQFSERMIQILPDVIHGMPLSDIRYVLPVLYGVVISDRGDMKTLVASLVQPGIFIPVCRLLTSIGGESRCLDPEDKVLTTMLQEIILKLLRISLSAGSIPLQGTEICENLPKLNDIQDMLHTNIASSSIKDDLDMMDTDMAATCIGLGARICLLSTNTQQEQALQCLLKTYTQRILEATVLSDDEMFSDAPLYREVFLVFKELCLKKTSRFGSLAIGPSETPLQEILRMME